MITFDIGKTVCLVSCLFLVSCGMCSAEEKEVEALLSWLDDADPVLDARMALDKGDNRLRAVHGFSLILPGVPSEKYSDVKEKYGFKVIEGTSDYILSEEHGRLNALAIEYSEKYNQEILNSVDR